jgi:elongation factor P
MIKGGNIAKGMYILFKGSPWQVVRTEFVSPGKGSAFTRAKLKSIKTVSTQEYTFKSTEPIEEIDVQSKEMQFLYDDGTEVVFMDPRTYEQVSVPRPLVEDKLGLMTTDLSIYILFYQDDAIGVRLPPTVKLKVTYSEDAVAGNRVTAPKKPVTVETGMVVQVPLFIKVGDVLSIETDSGQYQSRVNE